MINKGVALFYGLLLGDGCLSKVGKHNFVSIVGNLKTDEMSMIKISILIEKVRNKPVKVYKREKYGKLEICISDKSLFEMINGLGFPIGKKGTNLCIAPALQGFIKDVISGYFATDGCFLIINNNGIKYPRLEFSSIARPLLLQVRDVLRNNGIRGEVYVSHKKNFRSNNPLYRLQINGKANMIKFKREIGFFNSKHADKFAFFSDNFINK